MAFLNDTASIKQETLEAVISNLMSAVVGLEDRVYEPKPNAEEKLAPTPTPRSRVVNSISKIIEVEKRIREVTQNLPL